MAGVVNQNVHLINGNAHLHTARLVTNWLGDKAIKVVWDILKRRITQHSKCIFIPWDSDSRVSTFILKGHWQLQCVYEQYILNCNKSKFWKFPANIHTEYVIYAGYLVIIASIFHISIDKTGDIEYVVRLFFSQSSPHFCSLLLLLSHLHFSALKLDLHMHPFFFGCLLQDYKFRNWKQLCFFLSSSEAFSVWYFAPLHLLGSCNLIHVSDQWVTHSLY